VSSTLKVTHQGNKFKMFPPQNWNSNEPMKQRSLSISVCIPLQD